MPKDHEPRALTPSAHPLGPALDIPDRTPPSTARSYPGKRLHKTCEVCGHPYLVAPTVAHGYHTCSAACSALLRSSSQRQRQRQRPVTSPQVSGEHGTHSSEPESAPLATRTQDRPLPALWTRPDVVLLPRGGALVHCVRCAGLRGRWRVRELPPPELCWRCLMERNAGLQPGMPLG